MTPLPSIARLRRLISNINSNNNNSSHNKIPSDSSSATGTCASSSVKSMSELGTEEEQNNNNDNNNNDNNRSVIEDWKSALRAEHADLRRRIEEVCDDEMVSDAKKKKKKNTSKFITEPDERGGGNSSSSAVPGSPLKRRVSRHSYTIQEMALMSSPEKKTPRLATTATPETAAAGKKKKKSPLKNMKNNNTRRRNPMPSPPPKSTLYSSTYEIGARCYAKFTDTFWYWGTIVNILDPGAKYPSCSVRFDDGDFLEKVDAQHLYLELEYKKKFREEPPDPPRKATEVCSLLSLEDLFKKRCKRCSMCRKVDCGKCFSCVQNKNSTSRNRRACLFKACLELSPVQKAQPVPGLPVGWTFYFTDEALEPSAAENGLDHDHPALAGFVLMYGNRRYHGGVENAVSCLGVSKEEAADVAQAFYENIIGIKLFVCHDDNHHLVGKPICHQWIDVKGQTKQLFGTLVKCKEDFFSKGTFQFTVQYDEVSRNAVMSLQDEANNVNIPSVVEGISEPLAWGGCILHDKTVLEPNSSTRTLLAKKGHPFNYKWIVPTVRKTELVRAQNDSGGTSLLPRLVLQVRGFQLVVQAKKSGIPNAGLGAWLTCSSLTPYLKNEQFPQRFELLPGELVDLGLYAPLRKQDRKGDHIVLLKNFIHHWECESWSFEMSSCERENQNCGENDEFDIFDITDDVTGDIHDKARKNLLSYVNETDGKETATVRAEHDPEGAVHYLMGHSEPSDRPFRVPFDREVELKINYGPRYEKIRVRKGYSRLSNLEQDKLKKAIADDDIELIQEIMVFTAKEVLDSIKFLTGLVIEASTRMSTDSAGGNILLEKRKLARCLIATILVRARLLRILEDFDGVNLKHGNCNNQITFCDNGLTKLRRDEGCRERADKLVRRVLKLWPSDQDLQDSLSKEQMFASSLAEALNCNVEAFLKFTGSEIRDKILKQN